jgi:nitric oxide reductase NorD protein
MLGFSSVRRQHVRMQHLKGFDEPWGAAVLARVGAIKPGYYTRMGAAMRAGHPAPGASGPSASACCCC